MPFSNKLDRAAAIQRYTDIAHRLPTADFPERTARVNNLGDLASEFDVFVLDGFGVLNIGEDAIPGAVEQITALQEAGKAMFVLTNGATLPVEMTHQKYLKWGFNFELSDIVSSRNALEQALKSNTATLSDTAALTAHKDTSEELSFRWGVAATKRACINELASKAVLLEDDIAVYDAVDGFIFLSASDWSDERQQLIRQSLQKRSRPLLVGNPDLVAPRETTMSIEPGYYAHALADEGLCKPRYFGKPFANAFELIDIRLRAGEQTSNVAPHRIAMVGDTLHTDILGGAAFGWRTILIKNHGLMSQADLEKTVELTGVRPDFVAATT